MNAVTEKTAMLYCPKCRKTYEDGSRRFCTNEGVRLLPVSSPVEKPKSGTNKGVFSSLLNRPQPTVERRAPRYEPVRKTAPIVFEPVSKPQVFQPVNNSISLPATEKPFAVAEQKNSFTPEIKPERKPLERKFQTIKPAAVRPSVRLVNPTEIPAGTLNVRELNEKLNVRKNVSFDKPGNLIGQVVKGRYQITGLFGEDAAGLIYQAKDALADNRKVVVRIFINEDGGNLTEQILADERVSLSHINHPNIASLFDSGELPEGKPFIVNEFVEGESVLKKLARSGKFDPRRAGRIIRQAAYALGEAHQNGVLHRNLKPQNIILTVNSAGVELVKVTDFAVSDGLRGENDFVYLAPEQLSGNPSTFSSDVYSLAVIAYQILTNRLPFESDGEESLESYRRRNLLLRASDLRDGLPVEIDGILEKALAFEASERYPKARDFGDAFFNALINLPSTKVLKNDTQTVEKTPDEVVETEAADPNYISIKSNEAEALPQVSGEALWEKRSPEIRQRGSLTWIFASLAGIFFLSAALWGIWTYFLNNSAQMPVENTPPVASETTENPSSPTPAEVESPPPPRQVMQPPDTTYFQNTRDKATGELAKKYRDFSLFYPTGWTNTPSNKNFLDIARKNENGFPIEQMLVSYYDSKGTFKADQEKFAGLVKESNKLLEKQLPNYRFVGEGVNEINSGWKIYEMKFEAQTEAKNGTPLTIYGRRIFMPSMREGVNSGFLITMLATSLSEEVKSAEDVGTKGELKTILDTFEPSQAN